MPRRAGKATSRRARQRGGTRPRPPIPAATTPEPDPIPPVGTPDAREAVSLDPPRRTTPPVAAFAGSRLTDRERAEYHYVERDLRSIGVLTVVMAVLLVVAWVVFQALGLTT